MWILMILSGDSKNARTPTPIPEKPPNLLTSDTASGDVARDLSRRESKPDAEGAPPSSTSPSISRQIEIDGRTYLEIRTGSQRRLFYQSGSLFSEGTWIDDKREGTHSEWYADGTPWTIEQWSSGVRSGLHIAHHRNGTVAEEGNYYYGYRNGQWQTYYESGQLQSVGQWAPRSGNRQVRVGLWQYWHSNGTRDDAQTGIYIDGELSK
ncbi:MAG: hypothetical protein IPH13_11535 [Planctomycetes bacterium]|nr:hypothetical protein [Planctomycetota bacterium]MCC7168997.1 hypothetical protein [Planctomycetota bacterium]